MAPHSSTVAWKIPWMEEPGRLPSTGLLRIRHDWATSLPLFTFMHWGRKWQPTPMFLPEQPQGRGTWWAAVYGVAQSRTWLKRLSSSSSLTQSSNHSDPFNMRLQMMDFSAKNSTTFHLKVLAVAFQGPCGRLPSQLSSHGSPRISSHTQHTLHWTARSFSSPDLRWDITQFLRLCYPPV